MKIHLKNSNIRIFQFSCLSNFHFQIFRNFFLTYLHISVKMTDVFKKFLLLFIWLAKQIFEHKTTGKLDQKRRCC